MKRSKRPARPQKRGKPAPAPASPPAMSRRRMLGGMGSTALGVAVAGGGIGLLLTRTVRAELHEHDLDRIGKGIPMVVQVHDPMCPSCIALQRQARAAMAAFGEDELQYVVASLDKPEGRDLALRNGVGKVTLLLFDAQGTRRDILRGVIRQDRLERVFRRHVDRPS